MDYVFLAILDRATRQQIGTMRVRTSNLGVAWGILDAAGWDNVTVVSTPNT